MKLRPPPQYAAVDVTAIVTLTVIAMAGLAASLDGEHWIVVAGAGLGIGVLWTLLVLTLRAGMDIAIETLPIPFFATAGAIALRSEGLFMGIPDGTTLGEVMTGTVTGWRRLVDTAPPVDSEGVVLLIPFTLTLALSGIATAMALRSRRAVLPLMPLLLMLVVVLVLGTQEPLSALGQGVAFGVVALGWVGHRSNRIIVGRRGEPDPRLTRVSVGRAVASVAVVLLAAALVAPLAGTGDGGRRWVLRETIAPYDSASVTTPLDDFRDFRREPLAEDVLFTVKGVPKGSTVRIAVLDEYDGQRWVAASDRKPDDYLDRFLRVSSTIDNPGPAKERLATFRMRRAWTLDWLPVVGRVRAFEFYDDHRHERRDQVRYNRSTSTALFPGGLWKDDSYFLTTAIASDELKPEMRAWPEVDEELWAEAEFLEVPAAAWSADARTPMEALLQVAAQMRKRGRYSDGGAAGDAWQSRFAAGHDPRRLDEGFINAPMMVGNDEQYAAAMALLANRLGVPARVVVGARLRPNGKVRGKDIGAWVEVRVASGSWRMLPTNRFMSHRPPRREAAALPPVRLPDVGTPDEPGRKPQRQEKPPEPPEPPEPEEEPPAEKLVEAGRTWWPVLVPFALGGLVVAAKRWRRRKRRQAASITGRFAGAWDELLDAARDLGLSAGAGTRPLQAATLDVPIDLAREADVAVFAESAPVAGAAEDYWSRLDSARAALSRSRPWWRRALAVVNPISLLRPRR